MRPVNEEGVTTPSGGDLVMMFARISVTSLGGTAGAKVDPVRRWHPA
jgi:hypothetical protein